MKKNGWKIGYYLSPRGENLIRKFLDSLDEKQQVKILRIFQYIEEYGLHSVIPHLRKLIGTPLWEIKVRGKDNIRIIYVVPLKGFVLVLHGFIKKTQKTPKKEIETAFDRYKEWQQRVKLDK